MTTDEERFTSRFDKKSKDKCWLWTGTLDTSGYGMFSIKHRYYRAHRLAYESAYGKIPENLVIDHDCHNEDRGCKGKNTCLHRRCVNPTHLTARTLGENSKRGMSPKFIAWRNGTCVNGHSNDNFYRRKSDGQSIYCKICVKEKYKAKRALLECV